MNYQQVADRSRARWRCRGVTVAFISQADLRQSSDDEDGVDGVDGDDEQKSGGRAPRLALDCGRMIQCRKMRRARVQNQHGADRLSLAQEKTLREEREETSG